MRGVHKVFTDYLTPLLPTVARQDGHNWFAGKFLALWEHVRAQIGSKVGPLFDRMAAAVNLGSKKGSTEVLGVEPRDDGIDALLAQAKDANIRLVEDAARAYSDQVRSLLEDPANYGRPLATLKAELAGRGEVSESRAELIARDQTLKLNASLNEQRQRNAGVSQYVWSTCLDDRVRPTHAENEGETFSWDDPPDPTGHPGHDINCRCSALPVLPD